MAGQAIAAALALAGAVVGAAAAATGGGDPVTALAGRYSQRFDSCSRAGIAQRPGDVFVYQGPPDHTFAGRSPCRLVVRRDGNALAWTEGNGTCKAHCDARDSFGGDSLAWASRRPIRYLARLKASPEYRDALKEWRAR